MTGGIIYHCAECGQRLNIVDGYALCSRCHFDLTGEDEERDARERRERVTEADREERSR